MGAVHRAVDTKLGRTVAIKSFLLKRALTPSATGVSCKRRVLKKALRLPGGHACAGLDRAVLDWYDLHLGVVR